MNLEDRRSKSDRGSIDDSTFSVRRSLEILVGDGTFGRGGNECGILAEHAACFARASRFEGGHAGRVFGIVNEQVHGVVDCVDFDFVAAFYDADRPPWRLRGDVPDIETVAATGETAVGDECNFLISPRPATALVGTAFHACRGRRRGLRCG